MLQIYKHAIDGLMLQKTKPCGIIRSQNLDYWNLVVFPSHVVST